MRSHWVVLILVVILAACGGAEDRKAKHIELGESFLAEKNFEKARLEFKNAIQIDPKDPGAHFLLGKTREQLNDFRGAAKEYMIVIQLDEKNVEARARLGRLYLLGQAKEQAQKMVDEIQALEPDNLQAAIISSGISAQEGDIDTAINGAQKVLEADSANRDAIFLLASLYTKTDKADDAIKVLNDGLEHFPENTAIRLILSNLYLKQGKMENVLTVLKESYELQPDELSHAVRLATAHVLNKDNPEAEKVLREAVAREKEGIAARLALLDFIKSQFGMEAAENELQKYIAAESDNSEFRFALAKLYESEKMPDNAKAVYQQLVEQEKLKPPGLKARNRLARHYFVEKKPESAVELISEVLNENPKDREALLLRANYALGQKKSDDAIADLRTVLKDSPDDATVLKLLAGAHMANNEPNLALENLDKAVIAAPADIPTRFQLAKLQAENGLLARAEQNYKAILTLAPKTRQAHIELIKMQMAQKDMTLARESLKNFEAHFPDDPSRHYFKGLMHQFDQEFEQSIGAFKAALDEKPAAVEPMTAMARSYVALDRVDEGVSYFKTLLTKNPDNVIIKNMIGELLLQQKDFPAAAQKFSEAVKLKPEWWKPHSNLAKTYVRQDKADRAIEVYNNALDDTAQNERIAVELASLHENLGNSGLAMQQLQELRAKGMQNDIVNNNLAMLLVTYRNDDESLKTAAELSEAFRDSKNPAFLDTYGWVNLKLGKNQEALTALKRASKRAPNSAIINYHLGEAYYLDQQYDKAMLSLQKALESGREFEGKAEAEALLSRLPASGSAP